MSQTQTTTISVSGMTCGHCTSAVSEELKEIDNVQDVRIDLVAGGDSPVEVDSVGELDQDAVRVAVTEAGYTMTR
ncbi:MAG: heavy-metal-associated domain-containing protein [Ornithinimicrobium sp.]|jgi:copper chaperone CopZ|uniref:heavy-metal-associated domain-containing protein n=1 Tax=Ornithinimicrobium sp. TaxID=1977084 RepID=UPI003D9B62E2